MYQMNMLANSTTAVTTMMKSLGHSLLLLSSSHQHPSQMAQNLRQRRPFSPSSPSSTFNKTTCTKTNAECVAAINRNSQRVGKNNNRRSSSCTTSSMRIRSPAHFSSSSLSSSSSFVLLFALFVAVLVLLPSAQCATFFYGATEDSDSKQLETLPQTADEHTLALAESAAAAEEEEAGEMDETKLSHQELESVYKFCSLLPLLEEAGHVIKNKQARQVCDKLVAMLKPMFRKRNKMTRPRRTMMYEEEEAERR